MLGNQKKSKSASRQSKRATRKELRARNAGPSGFKISTLLMVGMSIFMLLIVLVGGLSAYYLQQNAESLRVLSKQNERSVTVLHLSNDMMDARVTLMTAARYFEEAGNDEGMLNNAEAAVRNAIHKLDKVRKDFSALRADMPPEPELRRLIMGLVASYQAYLDDGIEPMVQALESQDYNTFYFVSTGFGVMRALAFQGSIEELDRYFDLLTERHLEQAEQQSTLALIVIGAGLLLGLVIMVVLRIFLGRLALKPLREAGAHFDYIADGDLTQKISYQSGNEIGVLYDAMRRMQQSLQSIVATVREGVDEIASGSGQIFTGNTDLSSRTEQQAASLQETAASLEELASTVRQNSDNANQADKLAQNAASVARRGGESVGAVVNTMNQISMRSGQVADIVNVIDGIAFQTNILALNAAVEAARAGEQGKGFAVVAGEVRSLAQRSAQAAKEIKSLIEASLSEVKTGTQQVANAGEIIQDVVRAVNSVTTLMSEISSASQEQTSGIEQINVAVTQMDAVVQQNASLVEEAAAAAGSLQSQSERLAQAVAQFKINEGDVIDMPERDPEQLETGSAGFLGRPAYS
ncbi:MAG TPA: methyl-accepting chemotaxis protein [Alcaligenes sp.]|nr:methyl-accepting chemotaxis protein [Alcaligenes sp.]HRL25939.1 methyl-accepting chemotaxis protein [Alcaligenes sp.]